MFKEAGAIDVQVPKIEEKRAIKKLVEAFSSPLQRGFCYGRITNNKTLQFVFEHPLHVNEFKKQKESIKEKMRGIYKTEGFTKKIICFIDIDAVVKPFEMKKKKVEIDTKCLYQERSTGNFENRCSNPDIRAKFEEIRKVIQKRV